MKRSALIKTTILCSILIFSTIFLVGETLPLDVKKLSDRLMVVSTMTGNSRTAIVNARNELVMINAPISPDFTRRIMTMAEKKFGSKPWKYLIQTTSGDLNIGGSQSLSGTIIISHTETQKAINEQRKNLKDWLTWRSKEFEERVTRSAAQLKKMDPLSSGFTEMKQWIELCRYVAGEFKKDFTIPSAAMTFTDRLQINLGDMTMNLLFFGSASAKGQVFIWIPEEKFVWLSDAFHAWHILPHQAYTGNAADVKRWLKVLNHMLSPQHNVKYIFRCNGSHWTREQLVQRRDLIKDIYQKTMIADKNGLDLDATQAKLKNWKIEFPYLKNHLNYPEYLESLVTSDISTTITGIWKTSHDSAAGKIDNMLQKDGISAARQVYEKMKNLKSQKIYFSEAEFNSLGYRYMGKKKMDEAFEIFKMTVERYPSSANAYDSLGEAYVNSGNKKMAIKNYQKSLDLNPKNENAKKMLARLKGK